MGYHGYMAPTVQRGSRGCDVILTHRVRRKLRDARHKAVSDSIFASKMLRRVCRLSNDPNTCGAARPPARPPGPHLQPGETGQGDTITSQVEAFPTGRLTFHSVTSVAACIKRASLCVCGEIERVRRSHVSPPPPATCCVCRSCLGPILWSVA